MTFKTCYFEPLTMTFRTYHLGTPNPNVYAPGVTTVYGETSLPEKGPAKRARGTRPTAEYDVPYVRGSGTATSSSSASGYPHRSKLPITYHGRTGTPVIHQAKNGKRFIMVRKRGGGTRRLYEGTRYSENGRARRLNLRGA